MKFADTLFIREVTHRLLVSIADLHQIGGEFAASGVALRQEALEIASMMFTRLRYPSFKAINWRTTRSLPRFAAIILILFFTALNYEWMPAILFLTYLLYGFLRPWVSKRWRREIEEEIGEESENGEAIEL